VEIYGGRVWVEDRVKDDPTYGAQLIFRFGIEIIPFSLYHPPAAFTYIA
jgi:hypothetical protein